MNSHVDRRRPRGLLALLLTFTLCLAPIVAAQDYAAPGSGQSRLPDLDQHRKSGPLFWSGSAWVPIPQGLPNLGGMYCVPTAAMNVLAYLTHHGYPDALPTGPLDWHDQAQYEFVTETLLELGSRMGTHPIDGTLGFGTGPIQDWLDENIGPDVITVDGKHKKFAYAPSVFEIAERAHDGHVVVMGVGWYEPQPGGQWIRRGGHAVTISNLWEFGGYYTDTCWIGFRDPATGGSRLFDQSSRETSSYGVEYGFGQFSSNVNPPEYYGRTAVKIVGYGNANQGFLDGYYSYSPVFGIGPNGQNLGVYNPYPLGPDPLPDAIALPSLDGFEIAAVAIHPGKRRLYYTERDAAGSVLPGVRCVDKRTGETTLAIPDITPSHLVFDGGSLLYTIEGTTVVARNVDNGGAVEGTRVTGTILEFSTREPVSGRVFVISRSAGTMIVLDERLETADDVPLPSSLDLPGAEVYLSACPKSGDVWIRSSESDTCYRLHYDPPADEPATGGTATGSLSIVESFSDPALVGAVGLEATYGQRLYWVKDGIVRLHARDASGAYVETTDSPFAGLTSTGPFLVSRPSHNLTVEERAEPGDRNLLPWFGAAFLRGDCNGDTAFDIGDAIATLSFLFSGATTPSCLDACDSNDDGAVDIGDAIFTLAALFSAGELPIHPFDECGTDLTDDSLDCVTAGCP